jgi:hypothetical protein
MNNRRGRWLAAVALGLTLGIVGGQSAAAQDLQGTRSLSMGGSLRAAPSGDAAVLLNPAGMSLFRTYSINAGYMYRVADKGNLLNVSIVDSATKALAAGLSYTYGHASPETTLAIGGGKTFDLNETSNTHEAAFALSYPLASIFHLGLTAKYVYHSIEQPEGTPEEARKGTTSGFTLDAGGLLSITKGFNLAAVGYNLIPVDNVLYPRALGLGVSYAFGTTFLAEFDSVLSFYEQGMKPSFHGGGELFLGQSYAVRAGAMHDMARESTYVTAGLGLIASKIALDVGMRQMVKGGAETAIGVSIRAFLNNM